MAIEFYRGYVPMAFAEDALDLINQELGKCLRNGWNGTYDKGTSWFPTIREHPKITRLASCLPEIGGELCEPQILLGFPSTDLVADDIPYHLDQEPDWAQGRKYIRIAGVPLTPWTSSNGKVEFKNYHDYRPLLVGDALAFTPDEWHRSGINSTPEIRYGVYFRWLENA